MRIPILMYHNIGTPPEGARLRGLYVRSKSFARQMRLLRLLGYQGLSMSAAMPYLRGDKQGRVAVITLDDGYLDAYENALPALRANGFSATCYFVSDRLGQSNDWDAAALKVSKPLMSAAQMREWHAAGMEVGAHSRTHPKLTSCSDEQLQAELAGSKAELEALIGAPVTQFCYPYGDYDARVIEAARQAGYQAATVTGRGRARPGDDLMQLRRVLVTGSNMLHLFALKVLTAYEDGR
jgi:peptidoglycan/xylan/chitin deacetylase (PgdA/CDA1 family)